MNLLLPEQDFWWVESEMTTQINRKMPKVFKRRLFVPRRAKYYGAIKWAAANLLQQPPRTVAGLGLRSIFHRDGWLDVGQDLPIVGGDDLLHVRAGRVGQLQV